jgi:sugar phosphate isomerase/epimerase
MAKPLFKYQELKNMKHPVIMHINYCEQGQTIPEAFRKAAAWGYDGIELRGPGDAYESPQAYIDEVTEAADKSGLKHVLFGAPTANMMLPDGDDRKREVETNIQFYRMAKDQLGERFTITNAFTGSLFNPVKGVPYEKYELHGSFCATDEQWEWAIEGYRIIGEAMAEIGVRIALETHMCYLHDTPTAAKKLVDQIDNSSIGVNLDYANQLYLASQPTVGEEIETLDSSLFYVHLKNIISRPSCGHFQVGLADGTFNNREFLRELKSTNYSGMIGVEAPRSGDREWFAQQDLAYVRSLLHDLDMA